MIWRLSDTDINNRNKRTAWPEAGSIQTHGWLFLSSLEPSSILSSWEAPLLYESETRRPPRLRGKFSSKHKKAFTTIENQCNFCQAAEGKPNFKWVFTSKGCSEAAILWPKLDLQILIRNFTLNSDTIEMPFSARFILVWASSVVLWYNIYSRFLYIIRLNFFRFVVSVTIATVHIIFYTNLRCLLRCTVYCGMLYIYFSRNKSTALLLLWTELSLLLHTNNYFIIINSTTTIIF